MKSKILIGLTVFFALFLFSTVSACSVAPPAISVQCGFNENALSENVSCLNQECDLNITKRTDNDY